MTTMAYEVRLGAFAQGRRLRRFRGMLRSPGDTTCDACGSVMPNNLYGLRDMKTREDYFVGANCFAQLSRMLVLERPFVRANLQQCYERARGGAPADAGRDDEVRADTPTADSPPAHVGEQTAGATNGRSGDIQVVESDEFVTVFVRAVSLCGRYRAWGAASEVRYRRVWRLDPTSHLLLGPTREPRPDAIAACLARAQRMARQELEATGTAAQAEASTSA